MNPPNLLATLDRLPPFLCRLLARKNRGRSALSHLEIAQRAGLPKSTVADLSFKSSWAGVSVDVAGRYSAACGVDLLHISRQKQFLVRRAKGYILKSGGNERRMYARLFQLLKDWAEVQG